LPGNKGTSQKITREIPFRHREDAEWLTIEICNEYRRKAESIEESNSGNVGTKRALQKELQYRCDITELEAINIINGYHAADYVLNYEKMRNHTLVEVVDPNYLEWLARNDNVNMSKQLGDFGIEEKD